ncbi:MAG TPA: multidrug effflux MFS transporter [Noviherbaspirillum sp.]|uniref:multidrug effflux MFS transporter n=1 Tax=Noviherbaspirillum sp. TaxID=1926288 RepID=UPI002B498D85|nr:multidrug effflux MFS transporter [Noviherbaspirillum sp.]HJV84151.1 multidrug effflux MFS transporter [Noviherbaspirillum sp.]
MQQLRSLTLILAGLAMLGPFSIDTYLPSFASIARDFQVDPVLVQQTLSAYLACFATMMLFHGTLSDSFGRRPVIMASLGVYTLASAGAALAPSLGWLIAFRALQGLSAGAGTVVGRAMIRDRLSGAHAQKMLSDVTVVFAVAPAVAPVLGGWMEVWFGWRSVFAFLCLLGLLMTLACWRALAESLPQERRQPFHARQILGNYGLVLQHPRFLLLVFALALASIGYFVYIASAPHFVIDVLHLTETSFAWLFIPVVIGLVGGAGMAGRLAHHWSPVRLITLGYVLVGLSAAANLLYASIFPAQVPWAVLPLLLYTFGVSVASPSIMVLTLNVFPAMRGLAASMQAFFQTLMYAAVSALVAPLVAQSALRLAAFVFMTAAASVVCIVIAMRMGHEHG